MGKRPFKINPWKKEYKSMGKIRQQQGFISILNQ